MRAAGTATARTVALEVIRRVVEQGAYSNLSLHAALRRAALPPADRNLAAELAYGTIRRIIPLDWVLARFVDRPLERTAPPALALLRLGAYQLLFTRIPAHAAVSETVGLASPRHRGFVNAVLRRVAADPPAWPAGSSDRDVSIRTGLSAWAVAELRRQLGDEAEEAARALAERAPLTLRANACRTTVEELERALREAGARATRGTLFEGSLLVEAGDPAGLPGFGQGWFAVQDQASSFVVRALDPRPGERVLDACAGPGGKAGHMACLVEPDGAVVASDASPTRAALVRTHVGKLGLRAAVLCQDTARPALRGGFDRVLVDAPCTGMGAARRRPELLWRPTRQQLSGLARLQVAIVSATAELLAPGGRLVYSVCTFPRAETDAACDAIERHRPDLEPEAVDGPDGPSARIRLWPHRHGSDAMFVAAYRRRA